MSLVESSQPTYLDFRFKDRQLFGKKKRAIGPGDLVVDSSNIMGVVKYTDESKGNLIRFIDGYETFDKKLKIQKLQISTSQAYQHQEHYFGYITRLGRIITSSFKGHFPYVHMYNNGSTIFVRGSTIQSIVKQFTHVKIGKNHNFISVELTPFWNFTLGQFDVRLNRRKSWFAFEVLKSLFIDIDLRMPDDMKAKFIVNDNNEYNEWFWRQILKKFAKFRIKYIRK